MYKLIYETKDENKILSMKALLEAQQIKYKIKIKYYKTAATLGILDASTPNPLLDTNNLNEYLLYVQPDDIERVEALLSHK